jgi:hypothetical protein
MNAEVQDTSGIRCSWVAGTTPGEDVDFFA